MIVAEGRKERGMEGTGKDIICFHMHIINENALICINAF